MKGFIEVTDKDYGNKFLVSVSKIIAVDYDDENVYVVFHAELKRKRVERLVATVKESYEEIKNRIEAASK